MTMARPAPPPPQRLPPPAASRAATPARLARAEAHGRQVLLYAAEGPLGGSFVCFRCGAGALQPVLLQHAPDCRYRPPGPASAGR